MPPSWPNRNEGQRRPLFARTEIRVARHAELLRCSLLLRRSCGSAAQSQDVLEAGSASEQTLCGCPALLLLGGLNSEAVARVCGWRSSRRKRIGSWARLSTDAHRRRDHRQSQPRALARVVHGSGRLVVARPDQGLREFLHPGPLHRPRRAIERRPVRLPRDTATPRLAPHAAQPRHPRGALVVRPAAQGRDGRPLPDRPRLPRRRRGTPIHPPVVRASTPVSRTPTTSAGSSAAHGRSGTDGSSGCVVRRSGHVSLPQGDSAPGFPAFRPP